jgi:hypothetical protein
MYCVWVVGEIYHWYQTKICRQYMQIWRNGQSLQHITSLHLTRLYTSIPVILLFVQSAACMVHNYIIVYQSFLDTHLVRITTHQISLHGGSNREPTCPTPHKNVSISDNCTILIDNSLVVNVIFCILRIYVPQHFTQRSICLRDKKCDVMLALVWNNPC